MHMLHFQHTGKLRVFTIKLGIECDHKPNEDNTFMKTHVYLELLCLLHIPSTALELVFIPFPVKNNYQYET